VREAIEEKGKKRKITEAFEIYPLIGGRLDSRKEDQKKGKKEGSDVARQKRAKIKKIKGKRALSITALRREPRRRKKKMLNTDFRYLAAGGSIEKKGKELREGPRARRTRRFNFAEKKEKGAKKGKKTIGPTPRIVPAPTRRIGLRKREGKKSKKILLLFSPNR